MRRRWKRIVAWTGCIVVLALIVAGGYAWRVWRHYPKPPDVGTASFQEIAQFIASDDFNRMYQSHRARFVNAAIDRLQDRSFGEIAGLMLLDPSMAAYRDQAIRNLRKMTEHDAIAARLLALALEKFYALPSFQRKLFMSSIVMATELKAGKGGAYKPPDPEKFKAEASKTFFGHSPRGQALALQFMMDLQGQRDAMGLGNRGFGRHLFVP